MPKIVQVILVCKGKMEQTKQNRKDSQIRNNDGGRKNNELPCKKQTSMAQIQNNITVQRRTGEELSEKASAKRSTSDEKSSKSFVESLEDICKEDPDNQMPIDHFAVEPTRHSQQSAVLAHKIASKCTPDAQKVHKTDQRFVQRAQLNLKWLPRALLHEERQEESHKYTNE